MTGLGGEHLNEGDMAKGVTVVIVWASWSPRSQDVVERIKPLVVRWGSRVRLVTVDFEEERKVVEGFLAGKGLAVPCYLDADGAFSKRYAVATLPGLLVVKDGTVAYRGKLGDDADRVIAEVVH